MVRQAPFPHPLVPLGISASIPLNCLCFFAVGVEELLMALFKKTRGEFVPRRA